MTFLSPAPLIANSFLSLEWSSEGLTLTEKASGKTVFRRADTRVHFYKESCPVLNLWDSSALAIESDEASVTFRSGTDAVELELRCALEGRNFVASLRLMNCGADPVVLGDAQILVFDRKAGALGHLLADPCDVFSLGAATGETEETWSKAPGNKKKFAMRLDLDEPFYSSDNLLAARPAAAEDLTPHAVFSFDRIAEVASGVSIDLANGMSAVRSAFRGAVLPPGESRDLPSLYLDAISPIQEALAAAADRVAAIYHPPVTGSVPSGWCSWYYYYVHVTEADILENLDFLSRNRERFPYSYLQIDDGYQRHWGDWLLPSSKFPHDMAWLARRIKEAGLKPGIWVAPLIATTPSRLFREHPEWALRDLETGEPKTLQGWSPPEENPWVILDGTHPGFREHLKRMFHTMAHEWGFEYFKFDATAFGAYAGLRHDPARTGIEGVRMALQAIREAIGPDKYILGCGVPFGAAVGLVNGERVSDDVSTAFCTGQFVCPIESSMPQSIHRSFIHGKWWHNDPDCVLVRGSGTPHEPALSCTGLNLDEAQFFTTVVGLTQGIQMIGENLTALDEERLRLLEIIQPPLDAPAMPLDLFSSQPSRLLLHTAHGTLLGLLNWRHEEHTMAVRWSELGWPDGEARQVYELWTGACVATGTQSGLEISVPAHGARVLFFRPPVSHPCFLGFDGHISCGATLLRREEWNPTDQTLTLELAVNRSGHVRLLLPPGWHPCHPEAIPVEPKVWSFPLDKGATVLKLEFAQN